MLSAVAARKSRQQKQSASSPGPIGSVKEPKRQDIVVKSVIDSQDGTRNDTHPLESSRKKRRVNHINKRADIFASQEDVIAVSSGDDSIEMEEPNPIGDSSDEDLTSQEIHQPRAGMLSSNSDPLSTVHFLLDQNLFHLTPLELSSLEVTSTTATVLLLPADSTVTLLGVYGLTILRGSISFYGVTLSESKTTHRVFSPRSSPIPSISVKRTNPAHHPMLPQRIQSHTNCDCAIIMISELSTGIEGLGKICRTYDGVFNLPRWGRREKVDLGVTGVHLVTEPSKEIQRLEIPKDWENIFKKLSNQADGVTILIKGPKRSGKSTLARMLLNRLLPSHRVTHLELDPGQTEFTPPGLISLTSCSDSEHIFGPPWSHSTIPHASQFIGASHIKADPKYYLECVRALINAWDREGVLVINTMGWTKGLGLDIAREVERIVAPTHMIKFDSEDVGEELDAQMHTVESVLSTGSGGFTAAAGREMAMMSFFYGSFSSPSSRTISSWCTAQPLLAQTPYSVSTCVAFHSVHLIGAEDGDVVAEEIGRVLNGAIVAFGVTISEFSTRDEQQGRAINYIQSSETPNPGELKIIGLGLIRSISETCDTMRILTPIPPAQLQEVNVLIKGELELPIWGFLDHRAELLQTGDEVPYLQWGPSEGLGGDRRRVRRNLLRRGQM